MSRLKQILGWEGLYRGPWPRAHRSAASRPGVTVVIPTWNAADLLRACLHSLSSQELAPARILVVDNASVDATADVVKGFPGVDLLRLEVNAGYAGALARALEDVDTEYVAALNNDARPDSTWLSALVRLLDGEPRLGCAYPLAVRPDGLVDTAGDVITRAGFAYKRLYRRPADPPARPGLLVSPPGVAPVYRARALREVGGWDAGLHSQWDDVDVGIRLWRAGWDAALVASVTVIHAQGTSAARRVATREFLASRNETVVLLKTLPASILWRIALPRIPYLALSFCAHVSRGTALPFLSGKVAAAASVSAILRARRAVQVRRRLGISLLDPRWLRVWVGLSGIGGRRAPQTP